MRGAATGLIWGTGLEGGVHMGVHLAHIGGLVCIDSRIYFEGSIPSIKGPSIKVMTRSGALNLLKEHS